jgi:hypothetical protein
MARRVEELDALYGDALDQSDEYSQESKENLRKTASPSPCTRWGVFFL